MIAVGISWIPWFARVARGTVLSLKEQPYVAAARVIGCSSLHILAKHIFPNMLTPIIVISTLSISSAIRLGASLSFLGLGAQPPTPEWGAMLNAASRFAGVSWWWTLFPGLALMITVMSTSLFGDGLRDVLDPRLTR
jgi:peptide/nickel transport system permease protein